MADETASLIASVDKRLNSVSSIAQSDPYLFKVPSPLRRVNEKAYEPEMIAIGPYHRDRDYLQAMTEHKWWYLHQLLQRLNEDSAASYIEALSELEEKARLCYAEPITLGKDMFVQMLLLDGCFVVELIRKMTDRKLVGAHDPIFKFQMILDSVKRDLLLLENQLPFFILQELFTRSSTQGQEGNFIEMIFLSFSGSTQLIYPSKDENASQNARHLLELIHDGLLPPSKGINAHRNAGGQATQDTGLCSTLRFTDWLMLHQNSNEQSLIRCATELREAGIQFKKAENGSLFDIQFEHGRILIPRLSIGDNMEPFYRNLIAYEQFLEPTDRPHHVIDYIEFMDFLINTEMDVKELCRSGIIFNGLGDNKVVANMFNKLLENVSLYSNSSYYAGIYERVNKHCRRRWNVELANLRHNYFNSSWALISFLAAVVLLILTVVQTIYSVMSSYN